MQEKMKLIKSIYLCLQNLETETINSSATEKRLYGRICKRETLRKLETRLWEVMTGLAEMQSDLRIWSKIDPLIFLQLRYLLYIDFNSIVFIGKNY